MHTSIFRRLSVFLLVLTLPLGAFAASADKLITVSGTAAVSRGEFLKAAVTALQLPLKGDAQVPYAKSVPSALLPYVRAAAAVDALDAFGSDLMPTRSITRIEAARLTMDLLRLDGPSTGTEFTDVPDDDASQAAARLAVEKKWLKPVRAAVLGADKPLTGAEGRALIRKISVPGAAPASSVKKPGTVVIQKPASSRLPNEDMLKLVWQLLQSEYLHSDKIDQQEAGYRAAEALVDSLGDDYTTFLRPQKNKVIQEELGGTVTGIGAQVEMKDKRLTVVAPLRGSPAEKAGVLAGDIILSVNGESLEGLDLTNAVAKVRGNKGTTAKLRILRGERELDIDVVRDTVKLVEDEVIWKGRVAVVRLTQFGEITDKEIRGLMADVQAKNPQGIVIDLRNNPGGLLHAAEMVLSNFLPKGSVIAKIVSTGDEFSEQTDQDPTIDASVPVAVLVNKGSASASEIVAGALQDYGRAKVVGTLTFGKGSVQQVMEFRDGSGLKVTVAEWHTPKGRAINKVGVTPDVTVEAATDGTDPQLDKALSLVRS